jgi:hypothetical protein
MRWAIDLSPGGLKLPLRRSRLAKFIGRMVTRNGVGERANPFPALIDGSGYVTHPTPTKRWGE